MQPDTPINPRQTIFIDKYTDPDSPTYSNGTQSYKAAYGPVQDNSAATEAHRLLRSPNIRHRIDRILEAQGHGEAVRLSKLGDIISGSFTKATNMIRRDADGTIVGSVETTSTPGADSVIKAIDTINKLTGRYEQARQGARIQSKVLQSMIDAITSQGTGKQSRRTNVVAPNKGPKRGGRGD